jgi:DNA (cytosine-5)-methyltransferase 1
MFNTMHLFAGAGGGLLADLILGHTPIVAVEWDAYACAVLRERAADGWFPGLEVIEGDVRSVDFRPYKGRVDCIHAGFPCTDIAICGPSVGIHGERSGLYREAIRAVDEIRPPYLFMENSPEIVGRGLGDLLADLAQRGYDAKWIELGAADCWGGAHRRDRWWLLAADAKGVHVEESQVVEAQAYFRKSGGVAMHKQEMGALDWQANQPPMVGASDALADWVGRVKAIGNGQVPLCAATAWCILGGPVNHEAPPNSALDRPERPNTGNADQAGWGKP